MLRALKTVNEIMFSDVLKRKRKDGEILYLLYSNCDFAGYTLITQKEHVFEINEFYVNKENIDAADFLMRSALSYIKEAGGDRTRILVKLDDYVLSEGIGGKIEISVDDFFSHHCDGCQ